MKLRDFRPIEYRTVCAIARMLILNAPTMTDADWKAAVLDTCSKQGWDNPSSDMMARALGAVERTLQQTTGFRRGEKTPAPKTPQPDRCWTAADYRALAKTLKEMAARSVGAETLPDNVVPMALTTLEMSEPAALDQFYAEAVGGDRIGALRRFVEIAIVRPADWDYAAIRGASQQIGKRIRAVECFGCRGAGRLFHRHHVIQVQHGGSNYIRNMVALCEACHADVHPWLPKAQRKVAGWSAFKDCADYIFTEILNSSQRRGA